jgi:outer membrane protein assembly factor BamE (lipoprotein component of BamABCDE complex)
MCKTWIVLGLAPLLFIFCGCLIIPTPEHGGPYIAEEMLLSLETGKTQRADVLLLIGAPSERMQNDRFFVYVWERVAGYWFVGAYYSGAGGDITRRHYLCLEFSPNGTLKRSVHLEGVWKEDARERLEKWMAAP